MNARGGRRSAVLLGVAVAGALASACVDQGIIGTRDAAAAPGCEPACGAGLHCLPEQARCVECVADADCSASAVGPHCDLATHTCVACPPGEVCAPLCEDDEDEPFDDDDEECDEADGGDDDDDFFPDP